MEFDLQQLRVLFLVLLGLMLVTLVILVAYLVVASRRARRRGKREHVQEEELDPGLRPAWAARQATGQVVALLRDEPGSALQVEVGGTRYRRLAEIEDPQLKRQVVEATMDLVRFTGVLGVESIAPAPVDKTYSWREDLRKEIRAQGQQAPPRPASEEVEEQFLNLLSEIGPAPGAEKPNLATAIQQRRSSKPARQDQPRSVVDDIEAIVQRRVLLIPALTGRDLHVRLGAEGTVHFMFEGQDYEKPDDIPNMTARQLVKDAIQEWDETT
ncbi:MAG: hypothetical protein EHM56_02005 [Chloroflexi bacterium]|nr:MAG: hypothetical protein EHM56_02005 [Chloroflexota bacterium]